MRRLGGAMDSPTVAHLSAIIVRQLPPINLGTQASPQIVVLGLDWIDMHTPRRERVNAHRSKSARPKEPKLKRIDRHDPLDFNALMAWPVSKKLFFRAFGKDIMYSLGAIDAMNLHVLLLNCDGTMHTFNFDHLGVLSTSCEPRIDNYGEADLAIPHIIRTRFPPELKWEYHTCDWDSLFCIALFNLRNVTLRLNKIEQTPDPTGSKRKAPVKMYEVINGSILCTDIWQNASHVFAAMASGNTDYARPLSAYGIPFAFDTGSKLEAALFWSSHNELAINPMEFMLTLASIRKTKGRAVFIGDDGVIHLTSRTAPPGAKKTTRTGDMLHSDLIDLLWSVAYYAGCHRGGTEGWTGPHQTLDDLRLFEQGLTVEQALSGETSSERTLCFAKRYH